MGSSTLGEIINLVNLVLALNHTRLLNLSWLAHFTDVLLLTSVQEVITVLHSLYLEQSLLGEKTGEQFNGWDSQWLSQSFLVKVKEEVRVRTEESVKTKGLTFRKLKLNQMSFFNCFNSTNTNRPTRTIYLWIIY